MPSESIDYICSPLTYFNSATNTLTPVYGIIRRTFLFLCLNNASLDQPLHVIDLTTIDTIENINTTLYIPHTINKSINHEVYPLILQHNNNNTINSQPQLMLYCYTYNIQQAWYHQLSTIITRLQSSVSTTQLIHTINTSIDTSTIGQPQYAVEQQILTDAELVVDTQLKSITCENQQAMDGIHKLKYNKKQLTAEYKQLLQQIDLLQKHNNSLQLQSQQYTGMYDKHIYECNGVCTHIQSIHNNIIAISHQIEQLHIDRQVQWSQNNTPQKINNTRSDSIRSAASSQQSTPIVSPRLTFDSTEILTPRNTIINDSINVNNKNTIDSGTSSTDIDLHIQRFKQLQQQIRLYQQSNTMNDTIQLYGELLIQLIQLSIKNNLYHDQLHKLTNDKINRNQMNSINSNSGSRRTSFR